MRILFPRCDRVLLAHHSFCNRHTCKIVREEGTNYKEDEPENAQMRRLERERRGGSKAKCAGERRGGRMGGSPRLFPSDPRCVKGAKEKGEEELSAQKVFFGGGEGGFPRRKEATHTLSLRLFQRRLTSVSLSNFGHVLSRF